MPESILFIACSLDGYIARKGGGIDWLFSDQDYGYSEFIQSVGTTLMGRKTYEDLLSFGPFPYADKRNIVFSKTLSGTNEYVEFSSLNPHEWFPALKQESKGNIWVIGGEEIIFSLMQHHFIDRYRIFVHPVVLGGGIPLFRNGLQETWMETVSAKSFGSGLVELEFIRKN